MIQKVLISLSLIVAGTIAQQTPIPTAPHKLGKTFVTEKPLEQWLNRYQKFHQNLDRTSNSPKVIGILTQPVNPNKRWYFDYDQYIIEYNKDFIQWGGSYAVAIPFDASDAELTDLLSQINGVFFTGGGLDLVDRETGEQHVYYKTARKIFQHTIDQKDKHGIEFPILGICQGMELFGFLTNDHKKDTLTRAYIYRENRPVDWTVSTSRFFANQRKELLDSFAKEDLAFHFHTWTLDMKTYESTPTMKNFWNILMTDTFNGTTFINGMEAKNYPIYSTMFHPEFQIMDFMTTGRFPIVGNEKTDEFVFQISKFMNQEVQKNNNVYRSMDVLKKQLLDFHPMGAYLLDSPDIYLYSAGIVRPKK